MDTNATEGVDNGCNPLKNPLTLSELINGGANFEITSNVDEDFDTGYFNELNIDFNDEEAEPIQNSKELLSPWTIPFVDLRKQMLKISENMYKVITREGRKDLGVVPQNARVSMRYNAYWEGETAPFDSSYLRGAHFTFYTGQSEVLEGLEQAVRTMHQGEHASFVISYKLLFLEMGCPPRVKPKADALFIIELISFSLVGDLDADLTLSAEDRNKFSIVVHKVKDIHLKGLDLFKQFQFKNAARAFERATNVLNYCALQNEEEEREQQLFLIKLYTNLTVCYNKLNLPKRTCIMCKEIHQLTNNKPSCKVLFQEGKALHMLGDYDAARKALVKALFMEPTNIEINNEMKKLDEHYIRWKQNEKEIWSKALGMQKQAEENEASATKKIAHKNEWANIINTFKQNVTITDMKLPSNLVQSEILQIEELAKEFDLKVKVSPFDNTHFLCRN